MAAINYQFKMYMEGIPCPFESASISCSPNGVDMNIEVHPTDKIFDLAPKTHVAIFYKDLLGEDKWRLLGEGYFSGFAKYDNAAGARTVSLVCRDFRMDIRKTPAALVFQPDDTRFDKLYLMNRYGLKRTYQIPGDPKETNITSRTHGGLLRPFSFVIDKLSKTAGEGVGNNGRFLLDAFTRSIWIEAVAASTYGSFINTRIRADKRIVIPENMAGYRFFSKDYLNAFGEQVLFNNSMFSSVEAVIMRMGAIFQTSPVACSTPNIVTARNAMSEEVFDKIVKGSSFGEPYVLNTCMMLPPMNFTAPPNCNIIFPCMYDTLSWQHDYDSDVTRAYFRISEIFGGATELGMETKEVPTALLTYDKTNTPPLTIEERLKGSNIMEGEVEKSIAKNSLNDSYASDVMADKNAYIAKVKEKLGKQGNALVDLLKKVGSNVGEAATEANKKLAVDIVNKLKASNIEKINNPTVNNIIERHAVIKFLMSRFSSRIISVSSQLNPYVVCGFPAAVLADENNGSSYKTMRSIIGQVVTVKHNIHSSGQANTQIVMNCCRFISEPTDIDEWGTPLFVADTDKNKSKIKDTFEYDNGSTEFSPIQNGYPINKVKPLKDEIMDWDITRTNTNPDGKQLKWAKDILTISKEGREKGKDNLNFTDDKYIPTKIGMFYEEIFGQNKFNHFMIGHDNGEKFVFDSIHEALDNLSRSPMMNDYIRAMRFTHRDVVEENDYFIKILGCSFKTKLRPEDTLEVFSNRYDLFKNKVLSDSNWYGIPGNKELNVSNIKDEYYTKYKPGEFGSIYEKSPVTAFLKERINPVKYYIAEVNQRVNSTRSR